MKKIILATLLAGGGIGTLNAADIAGHAARPLVETNPQSLSIFAPVEKQFVAMNVRVYTSDGDLILNYRSHGETVEIPTADLADGEYRYESVAIIATDDAEEPEIARRNFGRFIINSGEIQPERTPLGDELSQVFGQTAGTILSWLVPSAQAEDFNANIRIIGDAPALDFRDVDVDDGDDWQIWGDDSHFRVFDWDTGGFVIDIDHTSGNDRSFVVEGLGNISLADDAVYIKRGSKAVGIGTNNPTFELDIHDTTPEIEFFDETDSSIMHLQFNAGVFAIEGNNSQQDIAKISMAAPEDSLFIGSNGRIGLGTDQPFTDLHLLGTGSSAGIALGASSDPNYWNISTGNAGIWFSNSDTFGNAAVKFSRAALANSLVINDSSNVGIGTSVPQSALEVSRGNGTAKILVNEVSSTVAPRTLFELRNPGNTKFSLNNTDAAVEWAFANPGTGFRVSRQGSGVVEFDLLNNGNLTIAGTLTENSDRNAKTEIVDIDAQAILDKVAKLPIKQWQYKDALGENHIGPMAQDFYAAFELGGTDKGIATLDSSGVALAAIQALAEENLALKQTIKQVLSAYHQQQATQQTQQQQLKQLQVDLQQLSQQLPQTLLTQQ